MRQVQFALFLIGGCMLTANAAAQQPGQPQLKIDPANRTLTVTANGNVTTEPEIAILHIGFETQLQDAKSAYAEGTRTSNTIIDAIKQTGIAESAIRSETQFLSRDWNKPHKFKLTQRWTVKVPPERAAEVLDAAVTAGANTSGDIDWTVKDENALEAQALDKAATQARHNAEVLAKGMSVRLGALIYVSNEVTGGVVPRARAMNTLMIAKAADQTETLAIEPRKVSRDATVYAVFAIE